MLLGAGVGERGSSQVEWEESCLKAGECDRAAEGAWGDGLGWRGDLRVPSVGGQNVLETSRDSTSFLSGLGP